MENLGSSLLRYNEKQKYLIWDAETCNLNLGSLDNKPWQFSFVVCDKNKILEEFNFYPWWDNLKISADAARITHFNHAFYKKNSIEPLQCLKMFESFLYNPEFISVGHNHYNFDFFIHTIFRKNVNLPPDYSYIDSGALDTNCIARAIKLGMKIPRNKMDRIAMMWSLSGIRQKGLKTSLGQLLKEENIEFKEEELHSGIVDCRKNFEIFKRQLFQAEF